MKKVLLALTLTTGMVGMGQNQSLPQASSQPVLNSELKVSDTEANQLMQYISSRKSAQKAKTAGGVINKQFIGYADTLFSLYGGATLFGGLFQTPIYKDSTLKAEFTNGTNYLDQHAISMTYDPSSIVWGQNTFSDNDAVTLDTVHFFGRYTTPSSIPNPSGDSLIVEVTWAPKEPASARNDAFQGVFYSPNANNPDTCRLENPLVDVSTPGSVWKLEGTNRIRRGIALTAADITNTGDPTSIFSIAINQNIPAGNLIAVAFRFKSAYSATTSVGDTFFSTVDVENTKIPNLSGRLASENIANGTRYFCDFGGMNSTGELTSATLYQTNGNFRDGMFAGRVTGGYFIYLTVSGTSTFGIGDLRASKEIEVYPNPSTGPLNISIPQGGLYQLELTNVLGQLVVKDEVYTNGSEILEKDLSQLQNGVYLLNISGENYSHTTKITIRR
jgi:hypothetical protein